MSKFDDICNRTLNEIAPAIAATIARPIIGAAIGGAANKTVKTVANIAKNVKNAVTGEEDEDTKNENIQMTGQPNQQQAPVDPKIMQELIAAKNEQQVQLALQKLQALQQKQTTAQKPQQNLVPKPGQPNQQQNNQPAV